MAILNEVKIEQNGEMAVVRVSNQGIVEVERDGATTVFGSSFTRALTDKAAEQKIPADLQSEIDQYIQLHEMKSQLEKQMKGFQENIRTYMDNNNMKTVYSTEGKRIELIDAKGSNSTSVYSDYELSHVQVALGNNELLRKCTEIRINTTKLEALLKVENIPNKDEILKLKICKQGTPRFTVKK
jgi:hypothetical protein